MFPTYDTIPFAIRPTGQPGVKKATLSASAPAALAVRGEIVAAIVMSFVLLPLPGTPGRGLGRGASDARGRTSLLRRTPLAPLPHPLPMSTRGEGVHIIHEIGRS